MSEASQTEDLFRWPRWFDRMFKLFLVFIAASTLGVLAENFALSAGWLPASGYSKAMWSNDPSIPTGWLKVDQVDPDGQVGKAGVVAGDLLKFDNPFYHMQTRFAGDRIDFTIDRNGQISRASYLAEPLSADPVAQAAQSVWIIEDLKSLLLTLFAIVLLVRRWREKTATSLALVLLAYGIPGGVLPRWADSGAIAWAIVAAQIAGIALIVFALPFCHYLAKRFMTAGEKRVVQLFSAVFVAGLTFMVVANTLLFRLPGIGQAGILWGLLFPALIILAIIILIRDYRATDAAGRNRIKLVAAAFASTALGYVLSIGVSLIASNRDLGVIPLLWLSSLLVTAGPFILVYTVLRHRVIDFGFVVNRTLVYGIVSAVILVLIGLAEWAAKKLVPTSWHNASAFYSAAIALGLFLLFHRIHHWVEHQVEHLFFRKWQANEAGLRQFIDTASHYERQDSLMRDTVAEFSRFTGTTEVALFWNQDGQDFARLQGELGRAVDLIDADDPAVAKARVVRGPVSIDETRSDLPASVILPVIDHGQIVGIFALGTKPNSVGYRPDEIEVMGWAAQQAGLDLQSMRARSLGAKVQMLEAQVDRLSSILAARTADA